MLQITLAIFILVSLAQGQINGEFWWLNSKLNNLKNIEPTPPKIDISDFQNDDSSRIIFRDDDWFSNKLKPIRDRTSKLMVNNEEKHKVRWPEDHMKNHDVEVFSTKNVTNKPKEHMNSHDVEVFATENVTKKPEEHLENHNIDVEVFVTENVNKKPEAPKPVKTPSKFDDVIIFNYPKNEKFVTVELNKPSTSTQSAIEVTESSRTGFSFGEYKLPTSPTTTNNGGQPQNICTYTNRNKCKQFNGFVYEYARRLPASSRDDPLVCCILPIEPIVNNNNVSQTIHFSSSQSLNRFKRSNTETNISLKQRDFLLKHKFSSQRLNIKPVSTPISKVVTPPADDYEDPYWNIKNTKVQSKPEENTKYADYIESQEYADELPKPGLVGLYSDHKIFPSWPSAVGNKGFSYGGTDNDYINDEEDEEEDTFGYSTIDPRQSSKKQKEKPLKFTTTADDITDDAEKHTISFQSNPDFHVFQGFKLLNLFRNTSRVVNKMTEDENLSVLVGSPESEEEDEVFNESQLFNDCGKVTSKKRPHGKGNQGDAASGSLPWLALVVLTKRQHNILCYATLVHPRAAITVGDCTEGTAPGDVTVIAGLWDLNDRSRAKSRVATVHVHPKYKPGEVDNNLALLHWMQPLQLSRNIQPACLGQPQDGNQCRFIGWGGLDQGISQPRPKWQRATVRLCTNGLSKKRAGSQDAFCATTPRGTVTGLGGPLICEEAGHSSIAGVVVSRSNGYVLSPVRDWTMKMESLVTGD